MTNSGSWARQIASHYEALWGAVGEVLTSEADSADDLPANFAVLRFAPTEARPLWTYATRGLSQPEDAVRIELHLLSPTQSDRVSELLFATAHYHRTGAPLDLGHTVNFGIPWLPGSTCDHGLISLPYLDGPALENGFTSAGPVQFYWLIPITRDEREFKKENGLDALEERFEAVEFNYADPLRPSVV